MATDDPRPRVFLSGSVGRWRERIVRDLSDLDIVILDPQRDDWDASWRTEADEPRFREQVEWELQALERSQVIAMYFDPKSQSPVSLLEFGLYARSGRLIVLCPEGFWRRGNVEVTADFYDVLQVETLEGLSAAVRATLSA